MHNIGNTSFSANTVSYTGQKAEKNRILVVKPYHGLLKPSIQ